MNYGTAIAALKQGSKIADYIQAWKGRARVRVQVPPTARKVLGKWELVHTLNAETVREAKDEGRPYIVRFLDQIKQASLPLVYRQTRHPLSTSLANLSGDDIEAIRQRFPHARLGSVRGVLGVTGDRFLQPPQLGEWLPADESVPMPMLAGFTYEEGIAEWIAAKGKNNPPADTTVGVYRAHLKRFFAYLGHNEMNRVTEQDILDYPAVLQHGRDGGKATGNTATNHHMETIRAVFRVAKFKRKITTDPTVGTIKKMQREESRREQYSPEQHAVIMAAALASDDAAAKWLWLFGLTLGCRIGELADATVAAVQQKDGHWVVNIHPDFRRNNLPLKTKGSARIAPIHSKLVPGFLAYVESVKTADDAPLFPMFRADRHGALSSHASRHALEWLRKVVGIKATGLDFHSCRHTVNSMLTGKVPDQRVRLWILGHDDGSVNNSYGTTPVPIMAAAIEQIQIAA